MGFETTLGKYINNIFKDKTIVSNESDFKMLLEHELMNDFDPSRITTEYEYTYHHGDYETSRTDIMVWTEDNLVEQYAIEVKYIITSGYDIHWLEIKGNESKFEEFKLDLMKIKHLIKSNDVEHGYAIYLSSSQDYEVIASKEAEDNGLKCYKDVINNVDNGIVGESPISLYLLIAYI